MSLDVNHDLFRPPHKQSTCKPSPLISILIYWEEAGCKSCVVTPNALKAKVCPEGIKI